MRVAIISHHFPPRFNAGAEQYAYRLARWLVTHGHTVEVICLESITEGELTPACVVDTYQDIRVYRLSMDLRKVPGPREMLFQNQALGEWVRDHLAHSRPEVVHINSGYLLGGAVVEVAHELGLPGLLTLHDFWYLCPNHTLFKADGKLCESPCSATACAWQVLQGRRRYRLPERLTGGLYSKAMIGLAKFKLFAQPSGLQPHIEMIHRRREYLAHVFSLPDLILSPSKFLIDKHVEFGLTQREIVYAPFGLDPVAIPRTAASPDTPILQVGYLGQFAVHKGVHVLVEAVQRINRDGPQARLHLYGRMTGQNRYEKEILRSIEGRDDITYHGGYDNAQVGEILSGFHVLAVPSIWYENRPTVILEAQMAKTPVVASRIGGIPELVTEGEDGFLFAPGSVDDLAAVLRRFVDDPGLSERLRKTIRRVPTVDDEMTVMMGLYEQAIRAKKE